MLPMQGQIYHGRRAHSDAVQNMGGMGGVVEMRQRTNGARIHAHFHFACTQSQVVGMGQRTKPISTQLGTQGIGVLRKKLTETKTQKHKNTKTQNKIEGLFFKKEEEQRKKLNNQTTKQHGTIKSTILF